VSHLGITVKYIYSACVQIETPDLKVLCDPWFTEGIYDGAWYHYPEIKTPLSILDNVDWVYISHIHPDHYDPEFLRKYFYKFGEKKIVISSHNPNYLHKKMCADGFKPCIISDPLIIGDTKITIITHSTGSMSDLDSALIVEFNDGNKNHVVVNANDIIFDTKILQKIKSVAPSIDLLMCSYTGAGPYPQTYYDLDDPILLIEAEDKKNKFIQRYKYAVSELKPRNTLPFAGKYILGGSLSNMNGFRGISDPLDIAAIDEKAIVLSDGGGHLDTENMESAQCRHDYYDLIELNKRVNEVKRLPMKYEKLVPIEEIHQIPFKKLIRQAYDRAVKKTECLDDYYFCIKIINEEYAVLNANIKNPNIFFTSEVKKILPRSVIEIDPRYLFGLLTGVYHWNNAEIGSLYLTRRTPNIHNKNAQSFLNFLSLC